MSRSNTSDRLKDIMNERSLRQVDILELAKPFCQKYGVKMNKSDLSQYISGKASPSQDKLVILGMALDVSESWLMGMDTKKSREADLDVSQDIGSFVGMLFDKKTDILEKYFSLSVENQEIVDRIISSLYTNERT